MGMKNEQDRGDEAKRKNKEQEEPIEVTSTCCNRFRINLLCFHDPFSILLYKIGLVLKEVSDCYPVSLEEIFYICFIMGCLD